MVPTNCYVRVDVFHVFLKITVFPNDSHTQYWHGSQTGILDNFDLKVFKQKTCCNPLSKIPGVHGSFKHLTGSNRYPMQT